MTPPGRVQTAADLRDIAEELGRPVSEIEQDFLLVRIAARFQADFPDQLCFKGGKATLPRVKGGRKWVESLL